MALKADRHEFQTDISFFMNEVADRGGVVCHDTTLGSGAAMDQGVAKVVYASAPSGKVPLGILLNDVVNIDLTRQKLNPYKNEVQKGSKVTILRKGYVVTDRILGAVTGPSNVFLAHSGLMSATDVIGGSSVLGQFMSAKDQDGYAKVEINLPATYRR
jgi:hypothetical protein